MGEPPNTDRKVRCPMCGSPDVRLSFPTFQDRVLLLFRKFEALRCRACRHRFRLRPEPTPAAAPPQSTDVP